MRTALLLVDIQYDFLPGGALAVEGGDDILPHAYRLMDDARIDFLVASQVSHSHSRTSTRNLADPFPPQDHHPPSHISLASRHSLEPFQTIKVPIPGSEKFKEQELWPDHCVQGMRGSQLEAGIRERVDKAGGVVVRKVVAARLAVSRQDR